MNLVPGRAFVGVLACSILVGACIASPAPPTPSPVSTALAAPSPVAPTASPSSGLTGHTVGKLTFVAPATWEIVFARVWTAPTGPRIFLSNDPIADPCAAAFLGGDSCWKPLPQLAPGGVLVTIEGSAVLFIPPNGTPPPAGPPDDICRALGGVAQINTWLPRGALHANGCFRGPDLAANEAEFDAFVASFRT